MRLDQEALDEAAAAEAGAAERVGTDEDAGGAEDAGPLPVLPAARLRATSTARWICGSSATV